MKTQLIAIVLLVAGLTGAQADVNPNTQQLDGSWMTVGFPAVGAPPSALPAAQTTRAEGPHLLSRGPVPFNFFGYRTIWGEIPFCPAF